MAEIFGKTLMTLTLAIAGCAVWLAAAMAKDAPNIKVALVFDLSGRREASAGVVKGIELARDQLRAKGVILDLISFNSQSDALGTRNAMLEALAASPDLIIAEVYSSKAVVAAEMAEQAKRVMITPYATSPVVTAGRQFVFRACFSDEFQGRRLADFAIDQLKARTTAIVIDAGQIYSKTLAESFRARYLQRGGTIVAEEPVLAETPAFGEILQRIAAKQPQLVFLPLYDKATALLLNEAIAKGYTSPTFLGGDGWGATGTFKQMVLEKKAPLKAFWISHVDETFKSRPAALFAQRFQAAYKSLPSESSSLGYDAAMLGVIAVSAAGPNASQQKIADTLRAMRPYQGVSGVIQFKQKQDPAKSMFVIQPDGKGGLYMSSELAP